MVDSLVKRNGLRLMLQMAITADRHFMSSLEKPPEILAALSWFFDLVVESI